MVEIMVDLNQRCGVCHCYLDEQDLFCSNCGTESPALASQSPPLSNQSEHHGFECKSCGASMSYDASAQALRCPFCGSTRIQRQDSGRVVKPDAVVLFAIARSRAEEVLRQWLKSGFWRPSDASRASRIGEVTKVYVPYWIFEADTDTRWTADSSPAPIGSRGEWYPLGGHQRGSYREVLVNASSILGQQETDLIAPFDIGEAVPPEQVDLHNVTYEQFRVPRKLARPLARAAIEQLELESCSQKVPNRIRNARVNVRVSSMRGRPVLLPVWILAYRYRKEVYRVLINGQTGRIAGTAPFSYAKLSGILLLVALVIAVAVVIAMLSNV